MPNMFEVIHICDERMTGIIQDHRDALDQFVEDDHCKHGMAKIYITLALAQSMAVRMINDGKGNENAEIL